MKNAQLKVAVVDDDDGVRRNMAYAVDRFEGCECVGQFKSAEEAMTGVPACSPDIVLMDINMSGASDRMCAATQTGLSQDRIHHVDSV